MWRKKKILIYISCVIGFLIIINPEKHGLTTYNYIEKKDISAYLHKETSKNLTSHAISDCNYMRLIYDNRTFSMDIIHEDLVDGHTIKEGGEYLPQDCKPLYSTAIIVPYRDRAEHLRSFLVYMHTFLRLQNIHYRIYIIEQVDNKPFNRAKLMNIGAVKVINDGFPCLVLHDIDLLPIKASNIYACSTQPRHMSSSINNQRFVLPYLNLFGGAVAITARQFEHINGMSNKYFGWGGEDDDFYVRVEAAGYKLYRYQPDTSQYIMLPHKQQQKSEQRNKLLKMAKERMIIDGLNSLKYSLVSTELHPLFTHIMVDL